MTVRRPNFFLVGAPKCGTTALHVYLGCHPDVFMGTAKENNHFATDLLPPDDRFRSRKAFLALFRGARDERAIGDSSVFHLFSRDAARNIREFEPRARILVLLRDPVDWLASYHAQMLYNGDETLCDLEQALAAETQRRSGRGLPGNLRFAERLYYSEIGRFAEQVRRYFDTFGRESVHVAIHDDLVRDPAHAYRATLDFLGIRSDFQPAFLRVNPNKELRSPGANEWLRRPPGWAANWVPRVVPRPVRVAASRALRRINTRTRPRRALPPELRGRLAAQLRPEVDALCRLLDRELSGWCA